MDKEKMAELSGESNYKQRQDFVYFDELRMVGTSGSFVLKRFSQSKGADDKYPEENIGGEARIIFLKIRRKAVEFANNVVVRSSNEYNAYTDLVLLSTGEKMTEKDFKKKYPNIKVQVVIYGLLVLNKKTEIVKMTVSGASLYSDDDTKSRFYNYLQSYAKDEHTFEFITKITTTEEVGDNGPYFAMSFAKEKQLEEKQLSKVQEGMEVVCEALESLDKNAKPFVGGQKSATTKQEQALGFGGVEYPTDDDTVSVDDIPF